ncbi:unnamed protein product [Soboliphyme baturini]|uniref:Secreted protein n=1 Tax=Soboliphyme baturini TaxID=241478 RepID=A0A183JA43_9BILA|nr:unnamed protein product [Soboliphyme baturini]
MVAVTNRSSSSSSSSDRIPDSVPSSTSCASRRFADSLSMSNCTSATSALNFLESAKAAAYLFTFSCDRLHALMSTVDGCKSVNIRFDVVVVVVDVVDDVDVIWVFRCLLLLLAGSASSPFVFLFVSGQPAATAKPKP